MLITNYQASQMESGFPFCRIKIKKHTEQAFDAKAVPNPLKKNFLNSNFIRGRYPTYRKLITVARQSEIFTLFPFNKTA
jgi:hypothetical protein